MLALSLRFEDVTAHRSDSRSFYINLPLGGLTALIVVIFYKPPKRKGIAKGIVGTLKAAVWEIDWVGSALLVATVTLFVLALQDAGLTRTWGDSVTIGFLVGSFLSLLAFIALQIFLKSRACIPPHIFMHRTIFWSCLTNFTIGGVHRVLLSLCHVDPS